MNTIIAELNAKQKKNDKLQKEINTIARNIASVGVSLSEVGIRVAKDIKEIAYEAHKDYPQYNNYWDDWKPVMIRRQITTKLGVAFEVMDFTIATPQTNGGPVANNHIAYSIRNGVDTYVRRKDVFWLDD